MPELYDFITFLLAYRELDFIIAFFKPNLFLLFLSCILCSNDRFFSTKLFQIFNFLLLSLPFFIPPPPHCVGLFVLRLPCITDWLYIHCVVEHDLQLQILLGCIFPCWDYRKTGSGHVTQNWLGFMTLLFQPPQYWNCKHVPCLSFFNEKNFNSNYSAVSLNSVINVKFYFSRISETVESTQITSALISK